MTLVIHSATPEWVRYAVDSDDPDDARIMHRARLVACIDNARRTGNPLPLVGWTLDEQDMTDLLAAITTAAQEAHDIALEKRLDRATDFASNWD